MMNHLNNLTWNQRVGYAFGAVYILVGAVGFAVTSGVGFAEAQGRELLFFELNPLHNLVHIAIGLTLAVAARASASSAKLMNGLVGATYLVVGIVGLLLIGGSASHPAASTFPGLLDGGGNAANILALNHPDNALHFASAVALLGAALLLDRRSAGSKTETDEDEGADVVDLPRGARSAGDRVTTTGAYSCSCGDFAVLIRKDMVFPDCPSTSGDAHYYTRSKKKAEAKRKSA